MNHVFSLITCTLTHIKISFDKHIKTKQLIQKNAEKSKRLMTHYSSKLITKK